MRLLALCLALVLLLAASSAAAADDGVRFRRTTPRATLHLAADRIAFGIPAGRAWGLESALVPIRDAASVALDLGVRSGEVREAFVRIAWYERETGRPRQMLVEDAPPVLAGAGRRVVMHLDPPEGAVALRIRVLGRVTRGTPSSSDAAITVGRVRIDAEVRPRPAITRLGSVPP